MKDLTLPTPPVTVRVLDTAIWIESDMFGAWHVVVQHEGMDAFTFATFNYRYGYTDNASTHAAAVQMAIDLGATEPVEERQRGGNFADAILAIRNGEVEYKSWEPVSHHEDGGRADTSELEQMRERKDAAYLERNQVVAALAKCFPSGVARTAIEGWSEDWHGCVYIDLPTGQASWHFHDSHAYLFDSLPPYTGTWDGHDTPEKYARLAKLGVALGGEKGEAVAWGVFAMVDGAMTIQYPVALSPAGAKEHAAMYDKKERVDILPLFAAPVGKARMLTDEEADHITGMHNTGRSQGDSECAEAIQRKFCEVNGITLEGGNRSGG